MMCEEAATSALVLANSDSTVVAGVIDGPTTKPLLPDRDSLCQEMDGREPLTGQRGVKVLAVVVAGSATRSLVAATRVLVLSVVRATGALLSSISPLLKFSNVVKLVFLWQFFLKPFMSGNKGGGSSSVKIQQFELKQHFLFGPVGYNSYQALPNDAVNVTGTINGSMKRGRPARATGDISPGGYFAMDIIAMAKFLRTAPPPYRVKRAEEQGERGDEVAVPLGVVAGEQWCKDDILTQRCVEEVTASTPPAFSSKPITLAFPAVAPVIVIDLRLNPNPEPEIKFLRDAVTFLIGFYRDYFQRSNSDTNKTQVDSVATAAKRQLEVVVVLESSGGSIHAYGLIAEQLKRLRSVPGITLTVCCDLVATSGGYMIASTASPGQLLASPFALIGSIGVAAPPALNVRQVLEVHGIKPIQVKSGHRKRRSGDLTLGTASDEDVQNLQENLDRAHAAFREHIMELRGDKISPDDYERVMSGDDWLGRDALRLGLVDRLVTSDEYLSEKLWNGSQVIHLFKKIKVNDDDMPWWQRILGLLLADGDAGASSRSGMTVLAPYTISIRTLLEIVAKLLDEHLTTS
jgi:ClpP class serine protease